MAEEDDFPPEVPKSATEFGFREFLSLPISQSLNNSKNTSRCNLLTVANKYGLIAVGGSEGFKVYLTADLLKVFGAEENVAPNPICSVTLRSPPHWMAFSSDNLTLVVCGSGEKGLLASFFDVRNLINTTKSTKTPFAVQCLSKVASDMVIDLHWNPSLENTFYLAICLSSGEFQILCVKDTVQELAKKQAEFGACSVCWSPRGKQMMIGRKDGSLQQYTPAMEIRRTVPVCEYIDRNVMVCDLLWLSTLQVAVTYVARPERPDGAEDSDSQPSLFFANLPPAKEQNKSVAWRNYEDPCFGMAGPQAPRFMTSYLDQWNTFVLASSRASETAIIGKNKAEGVWEIWNLDDACRAQLPMLDDVDTLPVGTSVILTATERIVIDDTREVGPAPIYAMLSNEGRLCLFHMLNLQAPGDYPDLVVTPQQLGTEGERAAAVSSVPGRFDLGGAKPTFTPNGKQKLSGKPSLLVKTSTPKTGLMKANDGNSSQLTLTPVQGFGTGQLQQVTEEPRGNSPAAKSLTNSFSMLANPTPVKFASPTLGDAPDTGKNQPSRSFVQVSQSADPSPALKSDSTKSVPFQLPNKLAPTGEPPSFKQPQGKAPTTQVQPEQAGQKQESGDKLRRKSALSKTRERVNSVQSVDGDSLADSLRSEIVDFDRELGAFFADSSAVKSEVAGIGRDAEKGQLKGMVEELASFKQEIARTTSAQRDEVKTSKTHCIELFGAVQNVEMRQKRIKNPNYRSALVSRPLDLADKKKMKEIRSTFQQMRDAVKQTNTALDEQWNKFSLSQKSSTLKKSKRRMQMEETNMIHKVVLNQMQILHDKERTLMLLGQQLDKLRLLSSSTISSPAPNFYKKQQIPSSIGAENEQSSTDLGALADSFLSTRAPANHRTPVNHRSLTAGDGKGTSPNRVSPKKTSQLSQILGSRKTTPIRAATGGKSNIIMPNFRKPKKQDTTSSSAGPRSYERTFSSETDRTDSTTGPGSGETNSLSSSFPSSELGQFGNSAFPSNAILESAVAKPEVNKPFVMKGFGDSGNSGFFSRTQQPPQPQAAPALQAALGKKPLAKTLTVAPGGGGLGSFGGQGAFGGQGLFSGQGSAGGQGLFANKGLSAQETQTSQFTSTSGEGTAQQPILRGSSTLSYGGPEVQVAKTKPPKFDSQVRQNTEAASNLNNPPQVVNIKDLKDPQVVNTLPFSATFQARPEVPPGAAVEVQKMLDLVAEQQNVDKGQSQAMSMLPQRTPSAPATEEKPPGLGTAKSQDFGTPPATASGLFGAGTFPRTQSPLGVLPSLRQQAAPSPLSFTLSGEAVTTSAPPSADRPTVTDSPISFGSSFGGSSGLVKKPSIGEKLSANTGLSRLSTLPNRGSASAPALVDLLSASKKSDEANSKEEAVSTTNDSPPAVTTAPPVFTITPKPRLSKTDGPPAPEKPRDPVDPRGKSPAAPPPYEEPAAVNKQPQTPVSTTATAAPPPVVTSSPAAVTSDYVTSSSVTVTSSSVEAVKSATTSDEASNPGGLLVSSAAPTSVGFGFGTAATGGGVFGQAAGAPPAGGGSVFGQASSFGMLSNLNKGPSQTTTASVFGAAPAAKTTPSAFGSAPSFGSLASNAPSSGGFGFGSTGGFLSGLGSAAPAADKPPSNPFGAVSAPAQSTESSSLFGNSSAGSFTSSFGQRPQQQPTTGGFGSNQSTPAQGFNAFAKPATGAFGSPPSFGASPAFGAKPAFGAAPAFGSASAFGQSPGGFGTSAAFSSPPGLGATTTSSGAFGSSGGFGAFSGGSSGFGALANQGGAGGGGFGSLANQNTGGGFGSLANQNPGGFGSLSQQQQPAPAFGSPAAAGFGGSASSGFGGAAPAGGFGAAPATAGGFGSAAATGGGGFGAFGSGGDMASPPQGGKPSFSGWR